MTWLAVVGSLNADLTLLVDHLPTPGETAFATSPALVSCGGRGGNQAAAAAAFGASGHDGGQGRRRSARQAPACGPRRSGCGWKRRHRRIRRSYRRRHHRGRRRWRYLILVDPGANSLLSPEDVETAGLPAAEAVIVQLEISLPTALLGVAGVLVPNLAELARLANDGRPADLPPASDLIEVARLARSLAGTADVVVTLGSRGALVVCRSAATSVHIAALPVATVDTTGAGDCFCGSLAASLADGLRSSRVVTTAR